jgi:hypothetical protein
MLEKAMAQCTRSVQKVPGMMRYCRGTAAYVCLLAQCILFWRKIWACAVFVQHLFLDCFRTMKWNEGRPLQVICLNNQLKTEACWVMLWLEMRVGCLRTTLRQRSYHPNGTQARPRAPRSPEQQNPTSSHVGGIFRRWRNSAPRIRTYGDKCYSCFLRGRFDAFARKC